MSSKFVFNTFCFFPKGLLNILVKLATFLSRVFLHSSSITLIRPVVSPVEFEKRKKTIHFSIIINGDLGTTLYWISGRYRFCYHQNTNKIYTHGWNARLYSIHMYTYVYRCVYIYNDVLSENCFVRGLVIEERDKGVVRVRFILSIRPRPSKGSFYFYFFSPRFFPFILSPTSGVSSYSSSVRWRTSIIGRPGWTWRWQIVKLIGARASIEIRPFLHHHRPAEDRQSRCFGRPFIFFQTPLSNDDRFRTGAIRPPRSPHIIRGRPSYFNETTVCTLTIDRLYGRFVRKTDISL